MKNKQKKIVVRKEIQSLHEIAELFKGKAQKEIYFAIAHLTNVLQRFDK